MEIMIGNDNIVCFQIPYAGYKDCKLEHYSNSDNPYHGYSELTMSYQLFEHMVELFNEAKAPTCRGVRYRG